jgi:3-oxoacyl-[acyl-carrier protein] reductase
MVETRVAVVTAAAGAGIGGAIARRLAEDGMTVVVTDAHERRTGELARELTERHGREMPGFVLDVTDPEAVRECIDGVVERLGRIDVLINNAGWAKLQQIAELDLENWRHTLDVDLNGTFYCLRYAFPHMIARGSGAIVNISSTAAWGADELHAAYAAAKAAVCALTRVAACEGGPHGIRVNAIAPGLIYNEFLRRIYPDEFFDEAVGRTMVGRVGMPDDVASLASFLVSDAAGYITGEVYGISGGESPRP